MTGYERVLAAFEHRPADRAAIYIASLSSQIGSLILGLPDAHVGGGIQQWREAVALWSGPDAHAEYVERCFQDAMQLHLKLELDYVRCGYWRMNEMPTERIDEYTFRYATPDGGWVVRRFNPATETYDEIDASPIEDEEADLESEVERVERDAEAFQPTLAHYEMLIRAQKLIGDRGAVNAGGVTFHIPYTGRWLAGIGLRPDLVERYLACELRRALAVVPVLKEAGLRFVHGGGDCAGNRGILYGPKRFKKWMIPGYMKISEACHSHGLFHLFGSDGDLWSVADELFGKAGVDGLYEMDREYMDPGRLRKTFPRLTLLGGIRSQVLHLGTRADVAYETRSALEVAREHGGMIVGCSNLIVPGTPIENVWEMMDNLHKQ